MAVISLRIYDGFRHTGTMLMDLDVLALRCGNREYRCEVDQGLQIPISNFRRICKLILKYGEPEDIDRATDAFGKYETAKRVWADEQARFKARRTR